MEKLPMEILQMIFNELSSLEDVQNCYKTCLRWQNIIFNLFQNRGKILVSSGCSHEKCEVFTSKSSKFIGTTVCPNKHCEILNMIDTITLQNEIFLDERAARKGRSCGGIIQNLPIICGGNNDTDNVDDCIILGKPNISFQMLENRTDISAVVLNKNTLWITGGDEFEGNMSTELISLDQPPIKGPKLPFSIIYHSMVKLDAKNIYLIGGFQNFKYSKDTWIIDPTKNFRIKQGPSLNVQRHLNSSSKMKIQGKNYLVVIGGMEGHADLDTVEILDTSTPNQKWKIGPKLPFKLKNSTMISSPTEKGVVVIGGIKITEDMKYEDSNAVIELSGDSIDSLKWTILKQKLQYPRFCHVAFPIPNDLVVDLYSKQKL